MHDKYEEYSREELLRLLRERDRSPASAWCGNATRSTTTASVNDDFVALDLDAELSCGDGAVSAI